jgi:hypothetical protein
MGGTCNPHGGDKYAYKILVVKPEGKRPLGRPDIYEYGRIILKFMLGK